MDRATIKQGRKVLNPDSLKKRRQRNIITAKVQNKQETFPWPKSKGWGSKSVYFSDICVEWWYTDILLQPLIPEIKYCEIEIFQPWFKLILYFSTSTQVNIV